MRKRAIFLTHQGLTASGEARIKAPALLFSSLIAVALLSLLALALTACEGGYTTNGERTSESRRGSSGEIDVQIGSANGSVVKEMEFDYSDAIADVEVTLEVKEGTFKLEFLGEDKEVTLALEASSAQKVSGSGYMAIDSFGEGEYRVTATEAKGVSYHISYQVR